MVQSSHEDQIWQLAESVLAAEGMEPILVECLKMQTRWVVRIYMDREEGSVTVDDCARVSNQLGDLLDVHDVPPGPYVLEVSSPGLDRPLYRDKDFLKYRGSEVTLRLGERIEGRRKFSGELVDYEVADGIKTLVIRSAGKTFRIPREAVDKANLIYK
ncbi:MAG: ribosome maturation factor RimP [Deltaproteobacteria bacterium]|nr:ribosome maturation factor RimP [Deltaproteobacteria bacterium]